MQQYGRKTSRKGSKMAVTKEIGCNNVQCFEASKCERTVMYENGTALEVKSFGGTAEKGCGKFIPKKEQ